MTVKLWRGEEGCGGVLLLLVEGSGGDVDAEGMRRGGKGRKGREVKGRGGDVEGGRREEWVKREGEGEEKGRCRGDRGRGEGRKGAKGKGYFNRVREPGDIELITFSERGRGGREEGERDGGKFW